MLVSYFPCIVSCSLTWCQSSGKKCWWNNLRLCVRGEPINLALRRHPRMGESKGGMKKKKNEWNITCTSVSESALFLPQRPRECPGFTLCVLMSGHIPSATNWLNLAPNEWVTSSVALWTKQDRLNIDTGSAFICANQLVDQFRSNVHYSLAPRVITIQCLVGSCHHWFRCCPRDKMMSILMH